MDILIVKKSRDSYLEVEREGDGVCCGFCKDV